MPSGLNTKKTEKLGHLFSRKKFVQICTICPKASNY